MQPQPVTHPRGIARSTGAPAARRSRAPGANLWGAPGNTAPLSTRNLKTAESDSPDGLEAWNSVENRSVASLERGAEWRRR